VGDVGGASADDAPDRTLLVLVECDGLAGAGESQVAAVEVARHEIVELIIVDAGEAVGALRIGPDPFFEGGFDLGELFLGGLGIFRIELTAFLSVFDEDIVDLRDRRIERIGEEQAGMAARGSPFGRRRGVAQEGARVDAPGRDFDGVMDAGLDADDLGREGGDDTCRDPRRAEPRGDVGRLQVFGLDALEGLDIASEAGIAGGGGDRGGELGPNWAREILVGRLPGLDCSGGEIGIEVDALAELGFGFLAAASEE